MIAASVCCATLIKKMAVSDETSLISSEVECMGLISILDGLKGIPHFNRRLYFMYLKFIIKVTSRGFISMANTSYMKWN